MYNPKLNNAIIKLLHFLILNINKYNKKKYLK